MLSQANKIERGFVPADPGWLLIVLVILELPHGPARDKPPYTKHPMNVSSTNVAGVDSTCNAGNSSTTHSAAR